MDQIKKEALDKEQHPSETSYVPPEIQTFSSEEFLDLLGPAQGYGGNTGGGERVGGRGFRLFPGLR